MKAKKKPSRIKVMRWSPPTTSHDHRPCLGCSGPEEKDHDSA